MPPQSQFGASQKYAVIQYLRETILEHLKKSQ